MAKSLCRRFLYGLLIFLLSGSLTCSHAACPKFGSYNCSPERPCIICATGKGGTSLENLLTLDANSRWLEVQLKKVSHAVYAGAYPDISHDIDIKGVFPISGGTMKIIYRNKVHIPKEAYPVNQYISLCGMIRDLEAILYGDFAGGEGGSFSVRGVTRQGNVCKLSGSLWANGKGTIRVGKLDVPFTFAPFSATATNIKTAKTGQGSVKTPVATGSQTLPPEAEFWTPEEKEIFAKILTWAGIGIGGGVSAYLALQLFGLLGSKPPNPKGSEKAVEEKAAPVAKPGDARVETIDGERWTQVFNGSSWVDQKTYEADLARQKNSREWQQEQFDRVSNGDTAFDRELQQRQAKLQQDLNEIHDRNVREHRESVKVIQDINLSDQQRTDALATAWDNRLKLAEKTKFYLDLAAMPAVGGLTGGVTAWAVQSAYTVASEVMSEATERVIATDSFSDAVKEGVKGAGIGILKGGTNLLVGEGLNAMSAVISKKGRDLLQAIPLRKPGLPVPDAPVFHESLPVAQLNKMLSNFQQGSPLMKNVDQGFNNLSVTRAHDFIKGKGFPAREQFSSDEVFQKAVDNFRQMRTALRDNAKWAAAGIGRSYLIDQSVGKYVNDGIFGKGS